VINGSLVSTRNGTGTTKTIRAIDIILHQAEEEEEISFPPMLMAVARGTR